MTTLNEERNDSADRVVDPTTLRQRAEEKARATGDQDLEALSPEEARRLLHELRVHQIELEMQNEELCRAREELEALQARARELDCLYGISALIEQPGISLEGILQGVVRLLPPAWRFPESTCARILYEDHEFRTENYRETEWRQAAGLVVNGRPAGRVEVYFSEPSPLGNGGHSRAREQNLLAAVAERLGRVIKRMQAEERLRTQEQLLEQIIDCIPALVAYADSNGTYRHVNRAYVEWFGRSREDFVGLKVGALVSKSLSEEVAHYLQLALSSREAVYWEREFPGSDGQAHVMRRTFVPHLDAKGTAQGVVAVVQDVSAQRHAEAQLRTQQRLLDHIIDSLPAYVAYLDSDLNILHANRAMADWWGYSKEQVAGKNFKEVAAPGGYDLNAPYLRQALASRETVTYERQQVSARGQTVLARPTYVPQVDEQGNVQGVLALILDVTAQRQAEEALRASEERYRLLVENMREGLAVVDEHALLTYVNDSLCEMTGWAHDELVGQASVKLFRAGDQERHLDWLARRRAGFSDTYEAVLGRRDGSTVPVLISASPILDREGNYRGSLAVLTDITQRVAAEAVMRRRVEELTMLNRIAHVMASAAELPRTLAQATEIIAALFAAHCVHVLWMEGEGAGFHSHVRCEPGFGEVAPTQFDVSLEELPTIGRVLREARSQIVVDAPSLPLSDLERELLVHRQVQSIMFIPLVIHGTTVGLLWVASGQPGRLFIADEVRLAETIAVDLAAAIENTRLARQAQAEAVAQERSRLARELHDSITQTLYSVSILAEALPRVMERDLDDAKRNARHMRQVVLGALAEMRTLLFELRPDALDTADLGVLLELLASSLRGRARVVVDLNIDGQVEPPPTIKVGLYRIAQEALNNVVRHARATHVTVAMQNLPDRVNLTIQDDGQGFDPDSVSAEQMGLRIMQERAGGLGLQLAIESQVGRGTKVAVTWQKDEGLRTQNK